MQSPLLDTQLEHDRRLCQSFINRPVSDPGRFLEEALADVQSRLGLSETEVVGFIQAAIGHLMDTGRIPPVPGVDRAGWIALTDRLQEKGHAALDTSGKAFRPLWNDLLLSLQHGPAILSLPVDLHARRGPPPDHTTRIRLFSYRLSLAYYWVKLDLQRLFWPPPPDPSHN